MDCFCVFHCLWPVYGPFGLRLACVMNDSQQFAFCQKNRQLTDLSRGLACSLQERLVGQRPLVVALEQIDVCSIGSLHCSGQWVKEAEGAAASKQGLQVALQRCGKF